MQVKGQRLFLSLFLLWQYFKWMTINHSECRRKYTMDMEWQNINYKTTCPIYKLLCCDYFVLKYTIWYPRFNCRYFHQARKRNFHVPPVDTAMRLQHQKMAPRHDSLWRLEAQNPQELASSLTYWLKLKPAEQKLKLFLWTNLQYDFIRCS